MGGIRPTRATPFGRILCGVLKIASRGCGWVPNTMNEPADRRVTKLLVEWSSGDQRALGELIPLVYGELRRLADRQLRGERQSHTLQRTALVHEAYLRLFNQKNLNWQGRAQLIGLAAQLMRRILIDHARARRRATRGAVTRQPTASANSFAGIGSPPPPPSQHRSPLRRVPCSSPVTSVPSPRNPRSDWRPRTEPHAFCCNSLNSAAVPRLPRSRIWTTSSSSRGSNAASRAVTAEAVQPLMQAAAGLCGKTACARQDPRGALPAAQNTRAHRARPVPPGG